MTSGVAFHICGLWAVTGYSLAAVLMLRELFLSRVSRFIRPILLSSFLAHISFVLLLSQLAGREGEPLVTFPETLAIISVALIAAVLYLRGSAQRMSALGTFVLPLALLFLLVSSVVLHLQRDVQTIPQAGIVLWFHIASAILGHVAIVLAVAVSAAVLVSEFFLKSKRLVPFLKKLPALAVLDELNGRLVSLGVMLMFVSVVVGLSFGLVNKADGFVLDSRVFWSVGIVLYFFTELGLREFRGLRGRYTAWLTIMGFLLVLASFAGVGAGGGFHVH